jgi:hypothetical protein
MVKGEGCQFTVYEPRPAVWHREPFTGYPNQKFES